MTLRFCSTPAAARLTTLTCALAAMCAIAAPSYAQMRANQAPVIAPTPTPAPAAAPDIAPEFEVIYRRAGRPRIVLLWNRTLSDRTQTVVQDKTVTRHSGRSSDSSSENTTEGPTGSSVLREGDNSFDGTKTVTKGQVAIEEPKRAIPLAERHAIALERAFVSEMARAGLSFVDRAVIMRTMAASQHRAGADALLVEIDAMLKHADLLMEVLWIEDKDAPAGHGFDVRVKHLRTGSEVTSLYSRGMPLPKPKRPGAWGAGAHGYEFRLPPPPAPSSPTDVGEAVARDVMESLGGAIAAAMIAAPAAAAKPSVKR